MLELSQVSWKNFLSYGDYITTLELSQLGQCLITGEVVNEDDVKEAFDSSVTSNIRKSNGAGKSNIIALIQWVLFGRTMHTPNPGDAVVNWYTGKDCWGQIVFKNGDSITRTRNTDGKNELIYIKDGDEIKSMSDTLSTAQNQQTQLARTFGLDWDIFCGSTFFSQYGQPWLEMADQTRKRALERLLHIDRFDYYAKVAKIKCDKLEEQITIVNNKKVSLQNEVARLEREFTRLSEISDNFAINQQNRQQTATDTVNLEIAKRDVIVLPDIAKLRVKWEIITKIKERLEEQRDSFTELNDPISRHDSNIRATQQKISLWTERGGKVCVSCEQTIPHEHVGHKIEPLQKMVEIDQTAVTKLREQQTAIKLTIKNTELLLAQKQPAMTVQHAQNVHNQWAQHDREVKRLQKLVEDISKDINPHETTLTDIRANITKYQDEITKIDVDGVRSDFLNKHYHYIYKAYHDRTKIKSFIFRDHIPYLNGRLRHYLEVFGLDVQVELTESLGITSNLWGYKWESGGERKRTDVAFMLATFDFHEHMFGRQCNVLVLDEVDGRMDDDGIDSLINIIKNDLANRVETTLIISHRNLMHDVFPREIKVKRVSRFSQLEVI